MGRQNAGWYVLSNWIIAFNKELGSGTFGTVSQAVNNRSHAVALKKRVRKCHRTAQGLSQEIDTLQALTALADAHQEPRILRLADVIYQYGHEEYRNCVPEDVYLVLDPFLHLTVANLVQRQNLSRQTADWVLRETMMGLKFLHDNGWMHGDIKPKNIGVQLQGRSSLDELGEGARVVLLDLDGSSHLATVLNQRLLPQPGVGGTVGYLAPERELEYCSYDSDVWAVGVTGYELRYGPHPWKLAENPWRADKPKSLRDEWLLMYESAISVMQKGISSVKLAGLC